MRAIQIHPSITPRSQKSLEKYLTEISRYPVLTPDEEVALFKRIQTGDEDAFNRVVNCNLRFVVSVSKKYLHCGLDLSDLINEGNEGLMIAAQRFDYTKGFKFISYAVWWIRQRIIAAINKVGKKIRKPANHQKSISQIRNARLELTQYLEREPSVDELADFLDRKVDDVENVLQVDASCLSLDATIDNDEDRSRISLLPDESLNAPDEKLAKDESASIICDELLNLLSERDARILRMSYGIGGVEPESLDRIGHKLNISTERVRQLRSRAIQRLRKRATPETVTSY